MEQFTNYSEWEDAYLSEYATHSSQTRGRDHAIPPSPFRTEFQRDRDRILHAKAFRRLMHKTQVFISPLDEHYRTRLTHTLEVTQIARTIARALRLNEDLTEAIGLGHDLGHTPFGHAGEAALRKCFHPTFSHNEQSLRVVERLEKDGRGLNLTQEVRDGILCHSGTLIASTLEGRVVKLSDKIAYINHDIDDAIRAGILKQEDLPKDILSVLGERHSQRINTMVNSVISASRGKPDITITEREGNAMWALHDFLFERVYRSPEAREEDEKAQYLVTQLYHYYLEHPNELPPFYHELSKTDGTERCIADYICGMTDRYALSLFERLFVPEVWRGCAP